MLGRSLMSVGRKVAAARAARLPHLWGVERAARGDHPVALFRRAGAYRMVGPGRQLAGRGVACNSGEEVM